MNIETIKLRSQVVRAIRAFFDAQDFLEVHTPRLVGLPGQEPYLDPMWTTIHRSSHPLPLAKGEQEGVFRAALITSPEYALKKLLGAGLNKIYDLGPCFRDGEPWDGSHDPEFLLLEWYRRDAGLEALMTDAEAMIRFVVDRLQSEIIPPELGITSFRRLTVRDAMQQYANVDLDSVLDNREALAQVVRAHGHSVNDTDSWDDLFFKIFLSEVEPQLGWSSDSPPAGGGVRGGGSRYWQPTFLYNYPISMAALARKDVNDPRYALRTELYIGDLELANGFAELCDPKEQRARFEEEQALRKSLGKDTWPIDERFIQSLPGMGEAAGMAFGVDRLVMLLAGTDSISDIMPIPVRERFTNNDLSKK